tara:strand:+ start:12231 stop:18575 length:6345 start_codon:yes stop_codon:yes gene_type:complete
MYEINGRIYTLQQLEQAAENYGMDFDSYFARMQEKGLKEAENFQLGPAGAETNVGSKNDTVSKSENSFSGLLDSIYESNIGQNYIAPILKGVAASPGSPVIGIAGQFASENIAKPVLEEVGEGFVGVYDAVTQPDETSLDEENIGMGYAVGRGLTEDPKGFFLNALEAFPKFADTSIEMTIDNAKDLEETAGIYALSWALQFATGKDKLSGQEKKGLQKIVQAGIEAKDAAFDTGIGKFFELLLPKPVQLLQTSRKEIDNTRDFLQKYISQHETTITEEIAKGFDADWATIGGRIFADGFGSLPYTLASMNPYTALAMGVGLAGDKFIQEFNEDPDKSLFRLGINAAGTGAIEIADAYLTRRFLRSANVLKGGGKQAEKAVKEMQKGFKEKLLDVIGVGFKEGGTEIAQAVATRINDRITFDAKIENGKITFGKGSIFGEVDKNGNVIKGSIMKDVYSIVDEGIIGFFTGAKITGYSKAVTGNQILKERAEMLLMPASIRKELSGLYKKLIEREVKIKELQDKGADPKVIGGLKSQQKRLGKKINALKSKSRLVLDNLSGTDLQKYAANVDTVNSLNENKDDKFIAKEIDVLLKENDAMFDKALKENYGEDMTFAEIAATQVGLNITKAKNESDFKKKVKNLTGKTIKDASGMNGVFIGNGKVIINEKVALKQGAVGVGSHEILHPILNAMIGDAKAQQTIVEDFKDTLTRRQRRWTDKEMTRQGKKEGTSEYYTEYINVFSEGIRKNRIGFDLNFGEQIKEWVTKLFVGKGFNNIDFRSGRGVYNFMKAYAQSMKDGKLNEQVLGALDIKAVKEAKAIGDNIQKSEISNEIQEIYDNKGFDGAFEIIEKYEGMANKHAQRFRDVPGFATNSDILVDEILTGRRGVIDLIRDYNPNSGVPLAAYINKFLPSRVIEVANRVLDSNFKTDITEERGIAQTTEEVQEDTQRPSLRLSLNLTQDVVDKVVDAVVKSFGTKLPAVTSKEFKKKLIANYKTFLKPTMANMMGTQQKFESFLNDNFKLIYEILPQSIINKRFKPFAEPVLDENGKQLRERTAQGNAIFRKKDITKKEFVEYFIGENVGKSTRGARKTALAEALAQEVAFDATLDVLRDPKVFEKIKQIGQTQEIDIADNYLSQVAAKIERGVDFQFSEEANNAEALYEIREAILDGTIQQKFPHVYKQIVTEARKQGLKIPRAFKGVTFETYQVKVINDKQSVTLTAFGDGKMGPTGTDITLRINKDGKKANVGVEVKLNGSDQYGSGSVKFDKNGIATTTTVELTEILPEIMSNIDVYYQMHEMAKELQNDPNLEFKFPQTNYTNETWQILKRKFPAKLRNQRILLKDGVQKIIDHYNNKGVYYIYIGGKGMYYMGSNPNNLNVPAFDGQAGVYVSVRSSGRNKTTGNPNLVFRGSNFLVNKGKDLADATLFSSPKFEEKVITNKFQASSETLNTEFNDIIEQTTGVGAQKTFSDVKGRRRGKRVTGGIFNAIIPYSAEDFKGLMYALIPKGKQGDRALEWINHNLMKPFAAAEENIDRERALVTARWKNLKKELKGVATKLLKKETPDGDYTFEHAVRVYIWDKQGMDIPGLTETDKKMLVNYVLNNSELREFADKVINVVGVAGYGKPRAGWDVSNISGDIYANLRTGVREYHLKRWKENRDAIFSKENMNKLRSIYGDRYIEALENILKRMETGRNRMTGNRQVDNWLNWLNASVGSIMFINRRSSVLQLISNVNYINWSDNNPLKAGAAFANQPQYWKDFMRILNSDYLVNRRGGNKININENEIAELAEAGKGGLQGAISWLLDKGFILTRMADSAAIASGGAGFFRNRTNTYVKQGMSLQEAETKAFQDFRELTEEAQQSSRADKISMEQAGGLGRVILAFANTPMQYARLQKRALQDLVNGRGDWKTNMSKVAYYGFVQNFMFNALQSALIAAGFDDDLDDERRNKKYRDVRKGMTDSILRGLGVRGAVISGIKNAVMEAIRRSELKGKKDYYKVVNELFDISPPFSSKISKGYQVAYIEEFQQKLIKKEGISLDNPRLMSLALTLSAGFNIPADRAIRTINEAREVADADLATWQRIMILLGWPKWQIDPEPNKKEKKKNPWTKNTWGKKTW